MAKATGRKRKPESKTELKRKLREANAKARAAGEATEETGAAPVEEPRATLAPESPVRFSNDEVEQMVRLRQGGYVDPFTLEQRAQHPDKHFVLVREDKIPLHQVSRPGFEIVCKVAKDTLGAVYDKRVLDIRAKIREEQSKKRTEARQQRLDSDPNYKHRLVTSQQQQKMVAVQPGGDRMAPPAPSSGAISMAFPSNPVNPQHNVFATSKEV